MQGDSTTALSTAQKAVFAEPARAEPRCDVASLTLQLGEPSSTLAILSGSSAQKDNDLDVVRASLGLCAVAESLVGGGEGPRLGLREAQRAIMLSPWEMQNWRVLAYVRGRHIS